MGRAVLQAIAILLLAAGAWAFGSTPPATRTDAQRFLDGYTRMESLLATKTLHQDPYATGMARAVVDYLFPQCKGKPTCVVHQAR